MARYLPLAALVAALSGCPTLPPPDGCTPRATRCAADIPQVCSATQRWTPLHDTPCGSVGYQCCLTRSPRGRMVHACVPAAACSAEGGAQ